MANPHLWSVCEGPCIRWDKSQSAMLQAVPGTADGSASKGAAAADCPAPGAALGRRVINSPADYGIELPAWLHTCIEHVPPGAGESLSLIHI